MIFPEEHRQELRGTMYQSLPGDRYGIFMLPARVTRGRLLKVVASDGAVMDDSPGAGWEHVSVSIVDRPERCPTWDEMCAVKDLFWSADECVVQFHPPRAEHVNMHPGTLHLWRSIDHPFPRPPSICV